MGKGNDHRKWIDTQGLSLKQEQKIINEQFLSTVLNGVKELVNGQMDVLSKKQEEYFTSFTERNKNLMKNNIAVGSSANVIIDEVETANKKLCNQVEIVDKNDLEMKANAEEARATLIDVLDTSKRQQILIDNNINKANGRMTELSLQSDTVGDVCQTMQAEKDNVIESVTKIQEEEKKLVDEAT